MDGKRQKILASGNLPTLPTAAVRLLELSKSPDTKVQELCDAIKSDPAITIRVIRAANASYFGLRNEVTSVEKAAMMLGPGMLTTITLTFYLAQQSVSDGPLAQHFSALWLRSIIQAAAAETILDVSKQKGGSAAFLAGLLCDVGQLAMLRVFPQEYAASIVHAKETGQPIREIEREDFDFNHVDVGIDLGNKWNLPQSVLDAITYHHLPAEEIATVVGVEDLTTLKAVIVGSAVADHLCGGGATNSWRLLRIAANELFELWDNELVEYLSKVHDRVSSASSLFEIDTGALPDISSIMAEATELLTESAMEVQAMTHRTLTEKQALEQAKCQLERENSEMHDRVIHDSLTGVYSRAFFEEQLSAEVKKCNRSGSTIGLIFCDIDHFKSINDQYGHPFGDQVLRLVGSTLQSALRESDVLARYGGEEFVAILTNASREGFIHVAEKLRSAVDGLRVRHEAGIVRVSISAGASFAAKVDGDLDVLRNRLIQEADEAMYTAKRNGRNQTRMAPLPSANGPATAGPAADLTSATAPA